MRLRFNKFADQILNNSDFAIKHTKEKYFLNSNPIYLEIGMGKGNFLLKNALKFSEINFIGIEKSSTIQISILKKLENIKPNLENLLLLNLDASELLNFFSLGSLSKIFLNFSDPWPKTKHHKRRLTYQAFLDIYSKILKINGFIEFKTDQKDLYDFTYEQILLHSSFEIIEKSIDLHKDKNEIIISEFEEKFLEQGNSIFYLKIKKIW